MFVIRERLYAHPVYKFFKFLYYKYLYIVIDMLLLKKETLLLLFILDVG